jgi:hypothetical protein
MWGDFHQSEAELWADKSGESDQKRSYFISSLYEVSQRAQNTCLDKQVIVVS